MDAIIGLQRWLDPLVLQLEPSQRRNLMRQLAQGLRVRMRDRIKQQRGPDGHRFIPRKALETSKKNRPMRFLYRNAHGIERVASITSYNNTSGSWTGYDKEKGAIRTFLKRRVLRFLPSTGLSGGSIRGQIGGIKRQAAMFKRIGIQIKTEYSPHHAALGFSGQIADIARVHQEGLMDRPDKKARPTRYARRKLIGFSDEDLKWVEQQIIAFLST